MHAHGNTYMCICIRIKVCMHVCMYECMYTACLHASMHVYICSRILHVHTHKRTGTQTSTHKHTRAQGPGCGLHGRSGHKTGTDGGDHPKACTLNSKPCKISKATTIVEQKEKKNKNKTAPKEATIVEQNIKTSPSLSGKTCGNLLCSCSLVSE